MTIAHQPHPTTASDRTDGRAKWKNYATWALQIVVALVFLAAGGAKLVGAESMVAVFEAVGIGQWFRYVTGTLEIVGALLLLLPSRAWLGAALLACIMVGAVVTHLFVIGGSAVPALVLLALTLLIVWLRRPARA